MNLKELLSHIEIWNYYFKIHNDEEDISVTVYPLAWTYTVNVEYKNASLWFSSAYYATKFLNMIADGDNERALLSQLIGNDMHSKTSLKLSEILISDDFNEDSIVKILKSRYLSFIRQVPFRSIDIIRDNINRIIPIIREIYMRYDNKKIRKYCKKIIELVDGRRLEAMVVSYSLA